MSITKIDALKGEQVNLKIHEQFGTVAGKLMGISGNVAKITFTSFGTAYTMVVPTNWIYTKNTEGKPVDLKNGASIIANIEAADVWARKVTVLDLNEVGILVDTGNRTRFFTWDRVKNLDVPREEGAKSGKKVVGKASASKVPGRAPAAPAGRLAKLAPKAPVRRAA